MLYKFLTVVIVGSMLFSNQVTACAKENMVPDYEVKLLLDSNQVLNSDKLLKKTYRDLFDTGKDYGTIGVLYIDTPDLEFNEQKWINRIRIKENKDKFDLTYKKRYSISDGDIEEALSLANQQGFDITDTNYEAQVDWGYQKMTLSISRKKKASNKGYDELELPKKKAAIDILKDKMPGKEDDWLYDEWGSETIENGKKFGLVYYIKYNGIYNETEVDIEVWPITDKNTQITEYITELSFKEDDYDNASLHRSQLIEFLENEGILLHEDSLKTQRILAAY